MPTNTQKGYSFTKDQKTEKKNPFQTFLNPTAHLHTLLHKRPYLWKRKPTLIFQNRKNHENHVLF